MRHAVGVAAALVVGSILSGCTTAAPTTSVEPRPRALVAAEARSDIGNDRPRVSLDGRMVRRRVVLAVRIAPSVDPAPVRHQLVRMAARSGTPVTTLSSSVLDPLPLDQLAPDIVVALPANATRSEGRRLMALALLNGRWNSLVRAHDVLSVFVHDLRFVVRTPDPRGLTRAIAQEGILADALGTYTAVTKPRRLDILYTGPLLGDGLVDAVRRGIARPAHVRPGSVVVAPRDLAGSGVDLSKVPAPAPVDDSPATGHDHEH